jgi:hypothetical protein
LEGLKYLRTSFEEWLEGQRKRPERELVPDATIFKALSVDELLGMPSLKLFKWFAPGPTMVVAGVAIQCKSVHLGSILEEADKALALLLYLDPNLILYTVRQGYNGTSAFEAGHVGAFSIVARLAVMPSISTVIEANEWLKGQY